MQHREPGLSVVVSELRQSVEKMSCSHCPICGSALEVIDVGPCWDCDHAAREIDELKKEKRTCSVFRAFGHYEILLCDFYSVGFGTYLPSYFGIPDIGKVAGKISPISEAWLPPDGMRAK
jgi:hypothetical protein